MYLLLNNSLYYSFTFIMHNSYKNKTSIDKCHVKMLERSNRLGNRTISEHKISQRLYWEIHSEALVFPFFLAL